MDETIRTVAWSIAEAWWRKNNRASGGTVPEAHSSKDYADQFWQSWCEEAKAAVACLAKTATARRSHMGSAFLAPIAEGVPLFRR